MTFSALNICLIGCGKMGGALLKGWLNAKIINRVYALDPAGLPKELIDFTPNPLLFLENYSDLSTYASNVDLYVIAIKPQIMKNVCGNLKNHISPSTPILSIAAGQTIGLYESYFSDDQPIIRAMPNTPASIGKGISVAVANSNVIDTDKLKAHKALESVGLVEWIDDENLIDAVTAVSGSGPAYLFFLIDVLAKAGEKAGLNSTLSMRLARSTIIGSAALAENETNVSAADLRQNVTSPGGTTEAALKLLMDGRLQHLFDEAIISARDRGKDLAS